MRLELAGFRPAKLSKFALAIALAMAGTATGAMAASGTFALATTYQIDRLYPHPQTGGTQLYVDVLFDPLVTVTKDGILPRLAKSWSLSEDGTTLTLELRDDVKYHDGTPFDANVAKAVLDYTITPESGAKVPAYLPKSTFEVAGPYTLVIKIPARAPELLGILAQYPMFQIGADGVPTTVGTGPFKLDRFDSRQSARFVRNDAYWGGPAKLDALELRMFADMPSALLSLEAGEIDAVIRPPISDVPRLEALDNLELTSFPDTGNMMWGVNARANRVTGDQKVRKALDLAFDRERFVQVALGGTGKPTNVIWPPASVAYFPEDESYKYDLAAAKQLLEEAGKGDGIDITIVMSSGVSQEAVSFAPIYQADLASIGVNATIEDLDTSEWLDKISNDKFDMYMTIYGNTGADPALAFTSGNFRLNTNLAGFVSDEYAWLEEAGRLEPDPAKRIEIYRELNRYMQEQAFALPFAQNPIMFIHSTGVHGLGMNSINNLMATEITVD